MFKLAKQPQSTSRLIQDTFALYIEQGRRVLGWGALLALIVMLPSFEQVIYGPAILKQEAVYFAFSRGDISTNLFTVLFIMSLAVLGGYSFLLPMIIYRLYQSVINLERSFSANVSFILSRLHRLLFATIIILYPALFLVGLFFLPGIIYIALMIFMYPYIVCEDAGMFTSAKLSVLMLWNEGGKMFLANIMRSIAMIFFPVLIIFLATVTLSWLLSWANPVFYEMADYLLPYVVLSNKSSLANAINSLIVQLAVISFLAPLQACAILIAFNDFKRRMTQ